VSYKTSLVPSSPVVIWSFEILFRYPASLETIRIIIVHFFLLADATCSSLLPQITNSPLAQQGSIRFFLPKLCTFFSDCFRTRVARRLIRSPRSSPTSDSHHLPSIPFHLILRSSNRLWNNQSVLLHVHSPYLTQHGDNWRNSRHV
jgi:hypothetical protein